MIWTAIAFHCEARVASVIVFTAAWDRLRAYARFTADHPEFEVVVLLAGDHADNTYRPGGELPDQTIRVHEGAEG